FERGEGAWAITADGTRYLDLGAGIAVNALGHANPDLVAALTASGQGAIEAADVTAALAGPATPRGGELRGARDGRLTDAVELHLQRYFDLHGDQLPPPGLYDRIMREVERPLIQIALDACAGNQLRCAELLGINRNTLRKKVSDLNIEVTRRRRVM
ncbi:aminotransferase class III-fold pyridoxal phosphate-dependent enzyme, partial [Paracoccus sanguinis]|uniref:aminotransferase class III-fold pyridoxal phosphate-dependent enzyme n=1 Tax=Paracoccus sanguinis TaxID=1545044 RepID=UPI00051D9480